MSGLRIKVLGDLRAYKVCSRIAGRAVTVLEMIRLVCFIVVGQVCYSYFCDCGK